MSKFIHVIKRSGLKVPFNPTRVMNAIYRAVVSVGGRDKDKAKELADKVIAYLEENCDEGKTPHVENIQDAVEKILIENGHAKTAKEFILYREERNQKRRAAAEKSARPSENIPWAKIYRILDWAASRNLHTVEGLNERIAKGEFPAIVKESEAAYENDLDEAAELIINRSDKLKIVIVTGPSSSGKTTTTLKLEQRLKKRGMKFVPLIVDNYFFDLEMHPKDEFGDYDFETPQALDLKLINDHLEKLCGGEEVLIPFYDFKTGKRHLNETSMKLAENEILLIDSLHGLYPDMTKSISDEAKFKVYIEPLLQMKGSNDLYIHWTDIRLIRRMLRDSVHRAYKPQQTLEHWHYVRSSELRHIIPYNNTADYIVSSGMPYELPLYSHKLLKDFGKWNEFYKDNPLREDAYLRASRVYRVLKSITPVEDESSIPGDSVLREFIGGSTIEY